MSFDSTCLLGKPRQDIFMGLREQRPGLFPCPCIVTLVALFNSRSLDSSHSFDKYPTGFPGWRYAPSQGRACGEISHGRSMATRGTIKSLSVSVLNLESSRVSGRFQRDSSVGRVSYGLLPRSSIRLRSPCLHDQAYNRH
jgi:hypothetical protein